MRLFYINYDSKPVVYNEKGLENFVKIAVLNNRDIAKFEVIEIDSRLSEADGFKIAQNIKCAAKYLVETQNGMTPFESITSHITL